MFTGKRLLRLFIGRVLEECKGICLPIATPGKLRPLPTPQGIFTDITIDFIEGLPKSQGPSFIMVVMERLTNNTEAVDVYMRDREDTIQLLKHHLHQAATRMKQLADRRRTERQFQIGDLVFLKSKPFMQVSVTRSHHKLYHKYYGPFPILDRVDSVAYKIQLPDEAKIHNVLHVSLLKPAHSASVLLVYSFTCLKLHLLILRHC
ncbi:hypothetical protein GH714_025093 [Hevea brasiliensis]|uniref:Tf2-1-like SH3-like domain-containing protein n=1 Tax=Hevea brasiliensis TaxID=3981 RepID=A0A6A6N1W1_HEVBR|nr:hypothetical protein GH714_025093 [Hevea brasiliensis]